MIIGATGFIGRELMKELERSGHSPVAVSRNIVKAGKILGSQADMVEWDGISAEALAKNLAGIEAIINLAGESISSGRWTVRRKKRITESRVLTGRLLAEAVGLAPEKPAVLIQGSAIGYYGTPVDAPAEECHPAGSGFMAELTREWESSADAAGKMIPRIVLIRTGLVLGKNSGLLKKLLLPFQFYSGAVIGSDRQWLSWIHISDEVAAIRFLLENPGCSGPFNLTAPNPVQMKKFIHITGKTLGKPVWLKLPGIFLKAALGEMAKETILSSQNIIPGKLMKAGFEFRFTQLDHALADLLPGKKPGI